MSIIQSYLASAPFSLYKEKWKEVFENNEQDSDSLKDVTELETRVPVIDKNLMMEEDLKKFYRKPLWMKDVEYAPPTIPVQLPPSAAPFPLQTRRMSKFGRHRKVSNYDPLSQYNQTKGQAILAAISEEEDFNRFKDYAIHKDIKSIRSRRPIYWNSTTSLDRTVAEDGISYDPLPRTGRPPKLLPLAISDQSHAEISTREPTESTNVPHYEPPLGRSNFHHKLAHEYRGDVFQTRRTSQGVYAGPLSAWQQSADSYIDSESHRRSRKRFTGKTNKTTFELSYSEENLSEGGLDSELGISRKRQVTDGPPHVGSLSRWFSRISPFQSGTSSID